MPHETLGWYNDSNVFNEPWLIRSGTPQYLNNGIFYIYSMHGGMDRYSGFHVTLIP